MQGKYKVVVSNKKLHYEFEIKRNITIIQGDSATGKTTLVDMIRQENDLGESSGINVVCEVPCVVLEGRNWKIILQSISKSIVFIDEGNHFVNTEEFASTIKNTDNYYVLITRENLYNLPYSVEEIYGIHSSGKYQNTRKTYQEIYQIYNEEIEVPISPKVVIVEDSNSGFEFFKNVCEENNQICITADGKSNLRKKVLDMKNEEICVIADGAAIGSEMRSLYKLTIQYPNVKLFLPESFEWIILDSGVIDDGEIRKILKEPENFIESHQYFSWERYFTKLLMEKSENTYLQYYKRTINPNYLNSKIKNAILQTIKGIDFNK